MFLTTIFSKAAENFISKFFAKKIVFFFLSSFITYKASLRKKYIGNGIVGSIFVGFKL